MIARGSTFALLVVLAGCQSSSSSAPPTTSANAPAPSTPSASAAPPATAPAASAAPFATTAGSGSTAPLLTVATIAGMAPGAHGWVRGLFLGWNGPCRTDPPTRSAWQIADGPAPNAACLYVDGPMPPGLSPTGAPGDPVWVHVDAELKGAGPDRWLVARDVVREVP